MDKVSFTEPASDGVNIDFQFYWRLLLRKKWNILALAAATTLIAVFVANSIDPQFQSTTRLLIERDQAKVVRIEEVYGGNIGGREYLKTQYEILKSRDIANKVVDRLSLTRHAYFDPRQKPKGIEWAQYLPFDLVQSEVVSEESIRVGVVNRVVKGVTVTPVFGSQLVDVTFESSDAKLSAQVANAYAETFIESHLLAKLDATKKATEWLSGRLGDLRKTLRDSERALQDYREQESLIDLGGAGVSSLGAKEFDELSLRYSEARKKRLNLEGLASQIDKIGFGASTSQLLELPSVLGHPLVQTLKEKQVTADQKVSELRRRYGPKHPKMIAANSDASSAMSELSAQVARVARGIEVDLAAAKSTENNLKAQVSASRGELQQVNRSEFKLKELEREVETNRRLFDMFMTRAKETDHAQGFQTAHARIVDYAIPASKPSKPNKKLIVIFGFLVGLGAGLGVLVLADLLDNTVRTSDDVESKLSTSLMGFIPLVEGESGETREALRKFGATEQSGFSESIRTIRTGLILSDVDNPHKVTLITSTLPNEGKSTVALNLAEAMSHMEKVLLIDADMRRPTMARTLGLPRNAEGLSALVAGVAEFKDCVHRLEGSEVDVLTAGVVPLNPLELLSSKRFAQLLDALKKRYDRIIIDAAPSHPVSDAAMLSTLSDAVLYVVKADETPVPMVVKGLKRLRDVQAPILGVVLNMLDQRKSASYGDSYAGYYQSYEED